MPTIEILKSLIQHINIEYKINFDCQIKSGQYSHHSYNLLIQDLFNIAKKDYRHIDANWLYALNWFLKNPKGVVDYYKELNIDILFPFFKTILNQKIKIHPILTSCFYSIKNLPLIQSQGPWGTNLDTYPKGISIETTGYKELLIHEFLHLFGVSDGYNNSFNTICDHKCWMQYQATSGEFLCLKHRNELIRFLSHKLN